MKENKKTESRRPEYILEYFWRPVFENLEDDISNVGLGVIILSFAIPAIGIAAGFPPSAYLTALAIILGMIVGLKVIDLLSAILLYGIDVIVLNIRKGRDGMEKDNNKPRSAAVPFCFMCGRRTAIRTHKYSTGIRFRYECPCTETHKRTDVLFDSLYAADRSWKRSPSEAVAAYEAFATEYMREDKDRKR